MQINTIALQGCIDAVKDHRIDPNTLYYVNADDSYAGLTEKVELAEQHGFHMLAPGHRDFRADMLVTLLGQMAVKNQAKDIVVVLDTLKKFVSLMEKNAARDFMMTVRAFVLRGGTVLALSHTNKNRRDDGSLVPAGTSDFVDDVDCAFVIDVLQETDSTRTVRFGNIKNRGPSDRVAAYRYSIAKHTDYGALLDSVERIPDADLNAIETAATLEAAHPPELVAVIEEHIRRGYNTKQQLVEKVAASTSFGQQKVRTTLDALEGTDPNLHGWSVTKGERGKRTYSLLAPESASVTADTSTASAHEGEFPATAEQTAELNDPQARHGQQQA